MVMILVHASIPEFVQFIVMPGTLALRPLADLASTVGLNNSVPLALLSAFVCVSAGSALWTAAIVRLMKLRATGEHTE